MRMKLDRVTLDLIVAGTLLSAWCCGVIRGWF
jgi:hypothetical protein